MAFIQGHYATAKFARKYRNRLRRGTKPAETTPVESNSKASTVKSLPAGEYYELCDRRYDHSSGAHDADRKPNAIARAARRHHISKQNNYFEDFTNSQF